MANPPSKASDIRLRKAYGDLGIDSLIKRNTSDLEAECAKLEAELAPAIGDDEDLEPYRAFTDGEVLSKGSKAHIDELLSKLTLESTAAKTARESTIHERETAIDERETAIRKREKDLASEITDARSSAATSDRVIKQLKKELDTCRASLSETSSSRESFLQEQFQRIEAEQELAASRFREKQLLQESQALSQNNARLESELRDVRAIMSQNKATSADNAQKVARLIEQRQWLIEQVERANAEAERRLSLR